MADQDTYGSGTNEFLGIVLKYESQKEQQNGDEGVGYRYRVAVMGNHPSDETVKDTDIIYAMVALGVCDGSGGGGRKKTVKLSQGDVVMGRFMDGDRKQNPVITNVLGRTAGIKYGTGRFDIKSGYVGNNTQGNLIDNAEFSETHPVCTPSARVDNSTDNRETKDEDLARAGLGGDNEVGAVPEPEDPKPVRSNFGGGRGGAASYSRALRQWNERQ